MAKAGPRQNQVLATPSSSPTWVTADQGLGPASAFTGSWIGSRVSRIPV